VVFEIIISFVSGIGFTVLGTLLFAQWAFKKYNPTPQEIHDSIADLMGDDDK
jgi:hypothetical protein